MVYLRIAYSEARALVEHLEDCHEDAADARNEMFRLEDELRENDPDFIDVMRDYARVADEEFNAMLEAGVI